MIPWLASAGDSENTPGVAETTRDVLYREGTARLLRFRGPDGEPGRGTPVLLVPSLINRWYVLDLRPGYSLVEALLEAGRDVYLLDWGVPRDEDRYLTWEAVLARLGRATRRVRKTADAERLVLLGFCLGGTLSTIHTSMHPDRVAGLIGLLCPVDFAHGGHLRQSVDAQWFDPHAMTAPGNLSADMMQAGFTAIRPTLQLAKWVRLAHTAHTATARASFHALETWADDQVPFPGAAYARYISSLYQANELALGTHRVGGRLADPARITCPVMAIVASRDPICPKRAGTRLVELVSSESTETLEVPGGHVGAIVGGSAPSTLYPGICGWLDRHLPMPTTTRPTAH